MKLNCQLANFILFFLLWPAAVFGALNNQFIGLWLILSAMAVVIYFSKQDLFTDIKIASGAALFGFVFEFMSESLGWLSFIDSQQIVGLPPVWIVALWAGMGLTFRHSNAWLFKKHKMWLLLWLACVPVTYLSAAQLGALQVSNWQLMYLGVFCGWSVYLFTLRFMFNQPVSAKYTGEKHA